MFVRIVFGLLITVAGVVYLYIGVTTLSEGSKKDLSPSGKLIGSARGSGMGDSIFPFVLGALLLIAGLMILFA